ncbi:unnamed protein product [Colias eurytheme]|nr:unnamed protein product [Colias eurytheme]
MALVEDSAAGTGGEDPEALLNEWLGELTVLTAKTLPKPTVDKPNTAHHKSQINCQFRTGRSTLLINEYCINEYRHAN